MKDEIEEANLGLPVVYEIIKVDRLENAVLYWLPTDGVTLSDRWGDVQ